MCGLGLQDLTCSIPCLPARLSWCIPSLPWCSATHNNLLSAPQTPPLTVVSAGIYVEEDEEQERELQRLNNRFSR